MEGRLPHGFMAWRLCLWLTEPQSRGPVGESGRRVSCLAEVQELPAAVCLPSRRRVTAAHLYQPRPPRVLAASRGSLLHLS